MFDPPVPIVVVTVKVFPEFIGWLLACDPCMDVPPILESPLEEPEVEAIKAAAELGVGGK